MVTLTCGARIARSLVTSSTSGSFSISCCSLVGACVQLVLVGRLHGELIQALGDLPADPDGRRILQIDPHSREIGKLGPQVRDDIVDQQLAFASAASGAPPARRSWARRAWTPTCRPQSTSGLARRDWCERLRRPAFDSRPSGSTRCLARLRSRRRSGRYPDPGMKPFGILMNMTTVPASTRTTPTS